LPGNKIVDRIDRTSLHINPYICGAESGIIEVNVSEEADDVRLRRGREAAV
jgi:hypothetical protein